MQPTSRCNLTRSTSISNMETLIPTLPRVLRIKILPVLWLIAFTLTSYAQNPAPPPKIIHAFVALCDNASQGIAPVPPKIGNGDDPDQNLYWGCDDGLRAVFSKSKSWQKLPAPATGLDPDGVGPILQRLVFRHRATGALLVGDAYRGREIKTCMADYFAALAGHHPVKIKTGELEFDAGGAAGLIAYLGHNGLMDFKVEVPMPTLAVKSAPRTAIALCCLSQSWFWPNLETTGARPLILTRQLMYPAAQLLHEGAAGWLAGADAATCTARAANAYATNQKISRKAAAGVLASGF